MEENIPQEENPSCQKLMCPLTNQPSVAAGRSLPARTEDTILTAHNLSPPPPILSLLTISPLPHQYCHCTQSLPSPTNSLTAHNISLPSPTTNLLLPPLTSQLLSTPPVAAQLSVLMDPSWNSD